MTTEKPRVTFNGTIVIERNQDGGWGFIAMTPDGHIISGDRHRIARRAAAWFRKNHQGKASFGFIEWPHDYLDGNYALSSPDRSK